MEWTVVTVIIALVGLFMTVGKPLLNLNRSITKLEDTIANLQADLAKYESKTDDQENKLNDHETRITVLERREISNENNSRAKWKGSERANPHCS